MEIHGPKSNLSLPLVAGESVVGSLSFGTLQHEREWPDLLKERLSVVADVFANALERKRSDLDAAAGLRGSHGAQEPARDR